MNPITIIGGGLAGLTLGIGLRQRDVPVTIVEAGQYPRHRVCGEFICGRGLETLDQLGVSKLAEPGAARPARDAAFFAGSRDVGRYTLPSNALCISRHILDDALAAHFQRLEGKLRTGERWSELSSPGVIWATGRRAQATAAGWRWFGLKVHARALSLRADLEMHVGRNTYVGLCRLSGDEVNVCGLFRRRVGEPVPGDSLALLRGTPGSQLNSRLREAEFDAESFCAVAGLSFHAQAISARECRVGDAFAMIPPITGNGMSLAFESADLATEPLAAYARGEESWEAAINRIAALFRIQFTRRLNWAWRFHQLMFSGVGLSALQLLFRSPSIWRSCFALTR